MTAYSKAYNLGNCCSLMRCTQSTLGWNKKPVFINKTLLVSVNGSDDKKKTLIVTIHALIFEP